MDNESNTREELYRRFRKSLVEPVAERFFDEDELCYIYDYAGDLNDDYVQLEVLLCGARLYPESHRLAERKALLYLDTEDDESNERTKAAENYLADNPELSSILFDIARLQVNRPENAEEALEFLLHQYDNFEDEEIIRFVDLACELDCYEWLTENLDRIADKVPFKPSLYYELAREADERADDKTLIKVADALIELEPFTDVYWMFLLRGQARAGMKEEAKQTFEYAKAIVNDSQEGTMALCDIVYHFAPELLPELIDSLKLFIANNPDEFQYVDVLCAIYSKLSYNENLTRKMIADYLDIHPESKQALVQYVNAGSTDIVCRIENYVATLNPGQRPEFDSEDLVRTLCSRGDFNSADKVMQLLLPDGEHSDPLLFLLQLEIQFMLKGYDRVIHYSHTYPTLLEVLAHDPLRGPATVYIYVVSLIKIGRYTDAVDYIKKIQPYFEHTIKNVPLVMRMAIRSLFTLFDKIERHDEIEAYYWEYFDMLYTNLR